MGSRAVLRGGAAWLLALCVSACGRCSDQLVVSGEHAYTRCRAQAAVTAVDQRIGPLTFRIQQRTLEITGLTRPALLAAFTGPGPGPAPSAEVLRALVADRPALLLALGDIGDGDRVAEDTLRALAANGIPTLLVAGARDEPARIEHALPKDGSVVDITGVDAVRIGGDTFVPLAGTHLGRYALGGTGCGFGADDLEQLTEALKAKKAGRRWLLGWEAPAIGGLSGPVAGDGETERFAQAIGAQGGLFAWPSVQAGRAFAGSTGERIVPGAGPRADLRLVVPRLTPPVLERADGSRQLPGYALLRLDGAGLQLLAIRTFPPS